MNAYMNFCNVVRAVSMTCCLLISTSADAGVITYDFKARVTSILERPLGSPATWVSQTSIPGEMLRVHDDVTGSFEIDTMSPQHQYSAPNTSEFGMYSGSWRNRVMLNMIQSGIRFDSANEMTPYSPEINVMNGQPSDYSIVDSFSMVAYGQWGGSKAHAGTVYFRDPTNSAFVGTELDRLPSFVGMPEKMASYFYIDAIGNQFVAHFTIDEMTRVEEIPEPSSLSLFFLSLGMLRLCSRSRVGSLREST
jgi:hypothetical protein